MSDLDPATIEDSLRNYVDMRVKMPNLASAFRPAAKLSTRMTLFVATADHPADISQCWLPYVDGPPDVHEVPVTHAEMATADSFTRIGPVLARKLGAMNGVRSK